MSTALARLANAEKIEEAARAYCAARWALISSASADSDTIQIVNVDRAWRDLLVACGYDDGQGALDV